MREQGEWFASGLEDSMKFYLVLLVMFLVIVSFFKLLIEFPWILLVALPIVIFMSIRYEKRPPRE